MNKKGQGIIVGMSIGAIILVVVLAVIFSFISGVSNTNSVSNETLAFTSATTSLSNESQENTGNATVGATYTLNFDDLTAITEIRNQSATIVTGDCNSTLSTGIFVCNATNSTNLFFDYTYINGRTETLANSDLTAQPTFRNGTSGSLGTNDCNATLSTGAVLCNNIHSATGFADYTYRPEGFVTSGTTRTLIDLLPVLLGIAVLIFILGFIALKRS